MKARLLVIHYLLLELMMLLDHLIRIETLKLGRALVRCRIGSLDSREGP